MNDWVRAFLIAAGAVLLVHCLWEVLTERKS